MVQFIIRILRGLKQVYVNLAGYFLYLLAILGGVVMIPKTNEVWIRWYIVSLLYYYVIKAMIKWYKIVITGEDLK